MAKLTLNADREVIEQAKRLAAERNTSVSAMFSRGAATVSSQGCQPLECWQPGRAASSVQTSVHANRVRCVLMSPSFLTGERGLPMAILRTTDAVILRRCHAGANRTSPPPTPPEPAVRGKAGRC